MTTIGVISDTHGMLRTTAENALKHVDAIIHAGDVGSFEVLKVLKKFAPVYAVRGNMDGGKLGDSLPSAEVVDLDVVLFYVIHDIALLDLDPVAAGMSVVIYGHSHKPQVHAKDGVIYLNPGSAGPRRFKLPITMAEILVDKTGEKARLHTRFIDLEEK